MLLLYVFNLLPLCFAFGQTSITHHANSRVAVYAGIGNFVAVLLFPILMYSFRMGATGAALSTVVSQ